MKCTVAAIDSTTLADVQIRFLTKEDARPADVTEGEFSADSNSLLWLRDGKSRELLVGLGAQASADALRQAAGTAVRALQAAGFTRADLDLRRYAAHAQRVAEGAILGAYQFDSFVPEERRLKKRFGELRLLVDRKLVTPTKQSVAAGTTLGECANYTRSIGDLPGNYATPETIAQAARDLAAQIPSLKATVLEEDELAEGGFGGLIAVGSGSLNPPRLIALEYHGGKSGEAPVALIGKAVTFDSGGICIKPFEKMDEMKYDKMGGCAVLGIMRAVAKLRLKQNIVGVIPAAENMLDASAYRPGDIVTAFGGKTIEILNTDAEGRVILADAMAWALEKFKPSEIIDYATLTGACVVALGNSRAGLFCSDEKRVQRWIAAGNATGEKVWELPHDQPYHQAVKSDIATVKNTGGKWGGACTAAAFLETWVGNTPWSHLDIAGTAWTTDALPFLSKGATAFGVRLTVDYLDRR